MEPRWAVQFEASIVTVLKTFKDLFANAFDMLSLTQLGDLSVQWLGSNQSVLSRKFLVEKFPILKGFSEFERFGT